MNYEQFLFYKLYTHYNPNFATLPYDIQFELIMQEAEKFNAILEGSGNLYQDLTEVLQNYVLPKEILVEIESY